MVVFPNPFDALPGDLSMVDGKLHMHHRGFLMDVGRLPGVESGRYLDGTIPSLPHADAVASDTTGRSGEK